MRVANDVRKLLAWLEGAARSADRRGWFKSHCDKALMLNFVEMNLSKAAKRIITVIPCEAPESWPELQIRTTQLPREGSPPSGLHYFRQSCHGISVG